MTNALGAGEHTFTKCSMKGGGGKVILSQNIILTILHFMNQILEIHTSQSILRLRFTEIIVFHDSWATKMANLIMESRKYPLPSSNLQAEDT